MAARTLPLDYFMAFHLGMVGQLVALLRAFVDSAAEFSATVFGQPTKLQEQSERLLPWQLASTFRAQAVEVLRRAGAGRMLGMLLAPHGQPVIQMFICVQMVDKRGPHISSFAAFDKCGCVSNQNQDVARTRQQHIQTLGSCHEPYVAVVVAARECGNHNLALFTLVIVFRLALA